VRPLPSDTGSASIPLTMTADRFPGAEFLSRREFARRSVAMAALAVGAPAWRAARLFAAPRWQAGIQLYTVRSLMAADAEGTLAALAAIGYREVELAGLYGMTAPTMRALLGRHGMVAPSSHLSLQALRDEWPRCLEDAQALGQQYLVCPWIDEADRTLDGYKRIAAQFNAIGENAKRGGLQFAYHDGDYAHRPLADGTIPYDIILNECDPKLVQMEIDLYWMVKGGGDPLAYFAKWPGRFPMLHVKDMTRAGAMTDVGQGTIDFETVRRHAEAAGVAHWFVEHDEPKSPLASARVSYAYLSALLTQPALPPPKP
jgi:sugar phosphate isomerase/epimerase